MALPILARVEAQPRPIFWTGLTELPLCGVCVFVEQGGGEGNLDGGMVLRDPSTGAR